MLPLGDPGPSTLTHRLRRLTSLPAEDDEDPLLQNAFDDIRSRSRMRPREALDDEEEDNEDGAGTPDEEELDLLGLEDDEIEEYELTAWDAIDVAIEQEARGASLAYLKSCHVPDTMRRISTRLE
jgi:hypothetical protein